MDVEVPGAGGHPVVAALAAVGAALDAAAGAPVFGLGPAAVAGLLGQVEGLTARLAEVQLRLVAAAESADLAGFTGAARIQDWLRDALRVAPGEAAQRLRLARALGAELAATGAALAGGAVSVEHAQVIRRVLAGLPAEVGAATRAKVQAHLLEQAATFDPVTLARLGRRVLEVVDPDAADATLARDLQRQERREGRASLRIGQDGHGTTFVRGSFPSWMFAPVRAALDPLAAPHPAGPDGPDHRPADQRYGEALVELAERALTERSVPTAGGEPVTVVVTMRLDDLHRLLAQAGGLGLLDDGEPVPPHALRRWLCTATILPAVLDGAGRVLDLGRTRRAFDAPIRRALRLRDGGCAFPGCDRPPSWCEAHHLIPWALGGPTSLDNGVLLCKRHHTLIHHGDWAVRMATDGLPEFIPPPWIDPHRTPRRNTRLRR